MNKVYTLTDANSLIDILYADILDNYEGSVIANERFNITIKITGEKWDGAIDYKVANFILELQNKIIKIYNAYSKSKINISSLNALQHLIVSVTVNKGCTEIIVHLKDILNSLSSMATNMESKHIFYSIAVCAITIGGVSAISKYLNYALEKSKIISNERDKNNFLETVKNIVGIAVPNNPVGYLARQMSNMDSMSIGGKEYSKKEAITTFTTHENTEEATRPETYNIDDRYEITVLYFEENTVKITLKGKTFKAITKFLSEEDKARLYDAYKTADIAQVIPCLDLHVAAEILDGKIISAAVIGLGAKRSKAVPLQDALKASIHEKKPTAEQATLF